MINSLKTFFFLLILSVLLVFLGSLFGKEWAIIALIFVGIMNFIAYFFSDKIVLAMFGAKPVSETENPELHSIVEELSQKAGIPKPKVYIIPSPTPNAFATGRNPRNAAVAVTDGILRILDYNELKGVLGHEITHIMNRDTLIQTVAATIAGAITYIARFGLYGFAGRDRRERNSNPLGLLLLILLPIAATLIQLAISRAREYLADDGGARLSGNPRYLAYALEKLAYGNKRIPFTNINPSTSHMFIVNPFSGSSILALFSTHPPIEKRIERLMNM
uniref:Protease HtpX homolog n=1 Tax=candidate division WOR-3 bacterium TaxID=2052148 RepID=A0A7C4UEV3_UNCW3